MHTKRIKMLVMDVDGTMTDGKIYMGPNGEAMKAFDVYDGYAIANMLPKMGATPVVITGRQSRITENRCSELGISMLYQNVHDKLRLLQELVDESNLTLGYCGYIGDDINDLECIIAINDAGGITACPSNAALKVKEACSIALNAKGGSGAIREFVELVQSATLERPS